MTFLIIAISLVTLITINYSIKDSLAIENITNKTQTLSELFKHVEKSVVQVSSEDETTELLGSRLGSGFVYDKNGHIITNNHVTSGGKDLHITFSDGTIYTGST
jgi:S1-C subfamily serine protease